MNQKQAAEALVKVLSGSRWQAVSLAHAYLSVLSGTKANDAARALYASGAFTLKRSLEITKNLKKRGFTEFLEARKKLGSAENPITKLFPAAITEQRFLEQLDILMDDRRGLSYSDERKSGHTLVDFKLHEEDCSVAINVKNAGTRFESALQLVGIAPDNCLPIPAYKAFDAVEKEPNLLYAVAVDYTLLATIRDKLLPLFSNEEEIVWRLLNIHGGALVRDAEDRFVYGMTIRHWKKLAPELSHVPFRLLSARKAIRILQSKPQRTPGLGLRAWGTGASAEVNVHIAIDEETKPWAEIAKRISENGLGDIAKAVNRKRTEVVYDPEI